MLVLAYFWPQMKAFVVFECLVKSFSQLDATTINYNFIPNPLKYTKKRQKTKFVVFFCGFRGDWWGPPWTYLKWLSKNNWYFSQEIHNHLLKKNSSLCHTNSQ